MALLQDLIKQIDDPALRERIMQETDKLVKQKKFGLVFEEHLPECTPLYDVPIRVGSKVAQKTGYVSDIYTVLSLDGNKAICDRRETHEQKTFDLDEIVSIAEFGEPIYPTLKTVDSVENAPDSDLWHTLIEADNYHALQLLEYLYAEKVDCIYIDPPYNTGARDWKYNNDYVDSSDAYRHSKWLSMMEKRLKIAKKLLNPKDSVLIVTIDEKEYLHLGCLLEEIFPEATMQMISSVINPAGAGRQNDFSRTDEYIFTLRFGKASVLPESREQTNVPIVWDTLRRSDLASRRGTTKGGTSQFYPIYVNDKTHRIQRIGEPLPPDIPIENAPQIDGCTAVFPIRDNGIEMNWGLLPDEVKARLNDGYVRVGKHTPNKPQKYVISYVTGGIIKDINSGKAIVSGKGEDGSVIAFYPTGKDKMPTTNWNRASHDAQRYGTGILKKIFKDSRFTFPKSLYAVHDIIRTFLMDKSDALIIDFFAGSGTTLHAVNLLNQEDGGHRRCILVTNNEVSEAEAKNMTKEGLHPGDEAWEERGIARHVTWPRTVCSIKGEDVQGKPLIGTYLGTDIELSSGFPANAIFFKLTFMDKTAVALGKQFAELLPVLWMKSGAVGKCPVLEKTSILPNMLILQENKMGVLIDEKYYSEFNRSICNLSTIKTIFIVTDSEPAYRIMISNYGDKDCYQLYRDYLDNFRINVGR